MIISKTGTERFVPKPIGRVACGRNHQWRGGQVPCRLQANGYIAPVPADGGLGGKETELRARRRHDPCVLPRAVPIVEAMTNLVVVDHWMRHHAQNRIFSF